MAVARRTSQDHTAPAHAPAHETAPQRPHGAATHAAGAAAVERMGEDCSHMGLGHRLLHSAMCSGHEIAHEALQSIVIALEIAVPVWIVSHLFGVGEILDIAATLFAANDIATATEELMKWFQKSRAAKTMHELEEAGEHFGKAVALVGVGFLMGIAAKFARGAHAVEEVAHAPHGEGAHPAAATPAAPHPAPAAEVHPVHAAEIHAAHPAGPHAKPTNFREQVVEARRAIHRATPREVAAALKSRHEVVEGAERAHKLGAVSGVPDSFMSGPDHR